MARVVLTQDARDEIAIDAPEGGALADLCDDHALPIALSCRDANCGTCRIEVLEGADELLSPEADELAALAHFGTKPMARLACRAKMKPGLVTLRIRVAI